MTRNRSDADIPVRRHHAGFLLATMLTVAACTNSTSSSPSSTTGPVATTQPGPTTTTTTAPLPGQVEVPHEIVDGFDDHTVSRIDSVGEFHALARVGGSGQSAVKFSIPEMQFRERRALARQQLLRDPRRVVLVPSPERPHRSPGSKPNRYRACNSARSNRSTRGRALDPPPGCRSTCASSTVARTADACTRTTSTGSGSPTTCATTGSAR